MSEFKGTKGEWEVVEHSWSDTSLICGNETIAELSIYHQATEENQEELEKTLYANSKLMSKAPEMLEMLKEVLAGRIHPLEYQSDWDMVNELIKSATEVKEDK